MTEDKWKDFADAVDKQHAILSNNNRITDNINNKQQLNQHWRCIQGSIRLAAFDTIPNHKTATQHKEQQPKYLRSIYYDIKHVNKIILRYNIKSWNRNKPRLSTDWSIVEKHLITIAERNSYHITLDAFIADNNYETQKISILDLKKALVAKAKLLEIKHKDENIKKFTIKRCDDYTSNKGAMINSFLERDNKKIII